MLKKRCKKKRIVDKIAEKTQKSALYEALCVSCAEIRNYPICQQKVLLLAYFFEQIDILVNLVLT